MSWPKWAREPLVHFLVAGALIFGLFAWFVEAEVDPASRTIVVDREMQAQLALRFERTLGRAPTDPELDDQIGRYLRDEVLYREALRLGLDQNDPVVRRRLASKMDLAASAAAEAAQPSEETLQAWFEENEDRYKGDGTYTFEQLYFASEANARSALSTLAANEDTEGLGEAISLPTALDEASMLEVRNQFGETFAAGLAQLEMDENWQGPLPSGFGWHLLRLTAHSTGATPQFEQIRERIENDWRSATIAARKDAAYDLLREAYRVEIER